LFWWEVVVDIKRIEMLVERIKNIVNQRGIKSPCFIIGCGRSGTTILGNTLALHSRITYLNEPRHLWLQCYPETDIWSRKAKSRNGRIFLGAADEKEESSRRLRQIFYKQTIKYKKDTLVEKLPANSFRLELIDKIFPDAKYVYIYRNGLEVSRSIAKFCEVGPWFGKNNFKWHELVEYSQRKQTTKDISNICVENIDRGLLEWRMSNESIISVLRNKERSKFFELSYADFMDQPQISIESLLSFLGLEIEKDIINHLNKNISRKTETINKVILSENEKLIGGELLINSIDSSTHSLLEIDL